MCGRMGVLGGTTPKMSLKCQKSQMPLPLASVKIQNLSLMLYYHNAQYNGIFLEKKYYKSIVNNLISRNENFKNDLKIFLFLFTITMRISIVSH